MNKYLVTLNFGANRLDANSRRSMRHAAGRWGAQFLEITRSAVPGFASKLRLDLLVPRCGRFAFFDRDVVIREDCPNLFELVPPGRFGFASTDADCVSEEFRREWYAFPFIRWTRALGGATEYSSERYFNSGVMVFDMPIHAHLFARARSAVGETNLDVSWFDEQGCLSASANLGDILTYRLPATFNLTSSESGRPLHPHFMSAFVYHFASFDARTKLSAARMSMWQKNGWLTEHAEGDGRDGGLKQIGNRIRRSIRRPGVTEGSSTANLLAPLSTMD